VKRGTYPFKPLKSTYNFPEISAAIIILIPPVRGVALLWNFLLLSGISTKILFDLAIFLKIILIANEAIILNIK
jgi:hypothetical protein